MHLLFLSFLEGIKNYNQGCYVISFCLLLYLLVHVLFVRLFPFFLEALAFSFHSAPISLSLSHVYGFDTILRIYQNIVTQSFFLDLQLVFLFFPFFYS